MIAAINAWTFPPETTPEQRIAEAADAGFDGIELVIGAKEKLTFATPPTACAELARRAADLHLQIVSLATADFWDVNYANPDPQRRQQACDMTLRMLDCAAALGAGAILVLPAVVGLPDEPRGRVVYADALSRGLDALCRLRHEAEARGVTIAVENVLSRFLLSPVEFADFIDRVNSGCVGAYLDVGNVVPIGDPEDWIRTLDYRIARVHVKDYDLSQSGPAARVPLGEGSVNWPSVIAALRQIGYDGPLTCEDDGDPRAIRRRLAKILDTESAEGGCE